MGENSKLNPTSDQLKEDAPNRARYRVDLITRAFASDLGPEGLESGNAAKAVFKADIADGDPGVDS